MRKLNPTSERLTISLPQPLASVSPLVLAAVLLVGRQVAAHLDLPTVTVEAILSTTGTSKSRAYELAGELADALPKLSRGRGRPPAPTPVVAESASDVALSRAVLAYVMRHPGCVDRGAVRQQYSDRFRHFIIELRAAHPDVTMETFAHAVQIPLPTLKDWLRDPRTLPSPAQTHPPPDPTDTQAPSVEDAQMQTVLDAWSRWAGTFVEFCEHLRRDLHIPFGRELIRQILSVHGARKTVRRPGRSPDELALRGAFRTFFPGAQWIGDGMQVPVVVDGAQFTVNLELDVDAYSGAFVGLSVRDVEDAAAVTEALDSGIATTGAPPLALLLDNRPSNHTPEVDAALGDTIRIRATTDRPQNKAHVEGAFGLFSRVLPPLVLDTKQGRRDLAASLVGLVGGVWARASNHRPRKNRAGRSRFELYHDTASAEQIERALRELRELKQRQDLARQTREARCRPEVLALLDSHFERLALLDPERHIRVAMARYPLFAIVDGIAIFDGKREAGTLPDNADARYLLGITKNVAAQAEGEAITRRLLELRLDARDCMLSPLIAVRAAVCANSDISLALKECVDKALSTKSPLDRTFWLDTLGDLLLTQNADVRDNLFLSAARRIEATYAIPPRERHEAVRQLAARVRPLE